MITPRLGPLEMKQGTRWPKMFQNTLITTRGTVRPLYATVAAELPALLYCCLWMSYKHGLPDSSLFRAVFSRLLANSLRGYNVSPLVKRAGMLTLHQKRLHSLRSGFLSCNTIHSAYRIYVGPFTLLSGDLRARRTDTISCLMLLAMAWVTKLFASDPEILSSDSNLETVAVNSWVG